MDAFPGCFCKSVVGKMISTGSGPNHPTCVIPDFVIQGGCPRGDGTGGPGYTIPCETSAGRQYHDRGVLSMAHRGKDTGGSQFFICMNRENTQHLDGVHTCFGRVIEGVDVIDDIRPGDLILSIRIVEE